MRSLRLYNETTQEDDADYDEYEDDTAWWGEGEEPDYDEEDAFWGAEEDLADADPELAEQFGTLEEAEATVAEAYASASRTFQDARDLVTRVKKARGYFPVVGIGAFDGLGTLPGNDGPSGSRDRDAGRGRGRSPAKGGGKS